MKRLAFYLICCMVVLSLGHSGVMGQEDRGIIGRVVWSPNGKYLATYNEGQLKIVEFSSQDVILTHSPDFAPSYLEWSPDSHQVLLHDWSELEIVDISTSKVIQGFQEIVDGHIRLGYIWAVTWSPDSNYLAVAFSFGTGGGEDTFVKIWSAQTGKLLSDHQRGLVEASDMAWSSDGTRLAISGFEVPTFVFPMEGEGFLSLDNGLANSVDWSPNNDHIATGELKGQACIWDAQNGELLNAFETGYDVYAKVKWSPDGTKLLVALEENWPTWVWYVTENRALLLEGFTSNGVLQVWSADSTQLVYEDNGEIKFLNLPPANEVPLIEPPNDGNGCIEEWHPDSL